MSLRVNTLVTHLSPEDALTLVEFLDQVRDVLMRSYGEDIRAMLKEARTSRKPAWGDRDEDPF